MLLATLTPYADFATLLPLLMRHFFRRQLSRHAKTYMLPLMPCCHTLRFCRSAMMPPARCAIAAMPPMFEFRALAHTPPPLRALSDYTPPTPLPRRFTPLLMLTPSMMLSPPLPPDAFAAGRAISLRRCLRRYAPPLIATRHAAIRHSATLFNILADDAADAGCHERALRRYARCHDVVLRHYLHMRMRDTRYAICYSGATPL